MIDHFSKLVDTMDETFENPGHAAARSRIYGNGEEGGETVPHSQPTKNIHEGSKHAMEISTSSSFQQWMLDGPRPFMFQARKVSKETPKRGRRRKIVCPDMERTGETVPKTRARFPTVQRCHLRMFHGPMLSSTVQY